ncbi:hypothetical protein [Litorivivens sp.]|uniref:hypothetical protein n=1 Tax=Litorivivens sp. TaxID=2020868 RepID=UPI003568080B
MQFQLHLVGVAQPVSNSTLIPHKHVALIVVFKDRWGIEGGALMPTMKINRDVIEKNYSSLADDWYSARQMVIRASDNAAKFFGRLLP